MNILFADNSRSVLELIIYISRFVECTECGRKMHQICVLHHEIIWPSGWGLGHGQKYFVLFPWAFLSKTVLYVQSYCLIVVKLGSHYVARNMLCRLDCPWTREPSSGALRVLGSKVCYITVSGQSYSLLSIFFGIRIWLTGTAHSCYKLGSGFYPNIARTFFLLQLEKDQSKPFLKL